MAEQQRTMDDLDLVGGHVALDFANSGSLVGDRAGERLRTYADLVTFARRADLLGAERAADLLARAAAQPARAEAVLAEARSLRGALQRVFTTVAAGARPAAPEVEVLNRHLAEGLRHRRLERDERCCRWVWSAGEEPLAQMLWPIVNGAAELLVEGELERVKTCGNETCAWLFVDMSRNRSRRWCDMKDCGNRAKARRHYARQRDAQTS